MISCSKKYFFTLLFLLSLIGLVDSVYLTWEHYQTAFILPCYYNPYLPAFFSDCGKVLNSQYAVIFGVVPLAFLGVIHYSILTIALLLSIFTANKFARYWTVIEATGGMLASVVFMYLMFIVIQGFCQYCFLSAVISFIVFYLVYRRMEKERKAIVIYSGSFLYQYLFKPVFFLIDPETIHVFLAHVGEFLGSTPVTRWIARQLLPVDDPRLHQTIAGIKFANPIGLSAGFDYEARLTQILPDIGFGFETVGTVTNQPYEGNPRPRLGRLPKSQSLMVNKGFKNPGADEIIAKLKNKRFSIPIGISIGRTNTAVLETLKQSIDDIVMSFRKFEKAKIQTAYYELNISCPNLIHAGDIEFYSPKKLAQLLAAVEKLKIKKPVFIKMPIEKSDKEIKAMLNVIVKFKTIKGVIFGNLQKNRRDPALDPSEVKKFPVGYFSGKPCEKRSNELIALAYKNFGKKLVIIGCGGVFETKDAYRKIKLGANLVQLITGMIYNGPQLPARINLELLGLLEKDGYKNIYEAVGIDSQPLTNSIESIKLYAI